MKEAWDIVKPQFTLWAKLWQVFFPSHRWLRICSNSSIYFLCCVAAAALSWRVLIFLHNLLRLPNFLFFFSEFTHQFPLRHYSLVTWLELSSNLLLANQREERGCVGGRRGMICIFMYKGDIWRQKASGWRDSACEW